MVPKTLGRGLLASALAAASLVAAAEAAGAAATPRATQALYVATKLGSTTSDTSCTTAAYTDINKAIAAAAAGATVHVCAGIYHDSTSLSAAGITDHMAVLVNKPITLAGQPGAIVSGAGLDNVITVVAPHATVEGLAAVGAMGEGILVLGANHVQILHNAVRDNDRGTAQSPWLECQGHGPVPGDCGEGIHLMSVTDSFVSGNAVEFNSGGILVTDELGPSSGNVVSGNLVLDNESDCGITVVGHNGNAVNKNNVPQPKLGGVYNNRIAHNIVVSNGTTGDGGGVLLAAGVPGGGSYDNTVTGNEIAGNGLSGVTIHQHTPVGDLSGDVISNNWIGTNDIDGDPGTGDMVTTGVLVDNGGTHRPIGVTITDNTIAWNTDGIYDDTGKGLVQNHNTFVHVAHPVTG